MTPGALPADPRVEVAWSGGDELGESPRWDERRQVLHRVDVVGGAVLTLDLRAGTERRYPMGSPVGCVVLREDGDGLLVAVAEGLRSLDTGTGEVVPVADVGHDAARLQLNDGACDPSGRLLVGSLSRDGAPGGGVLYACTPSGGFRPLLRGVGVSNGLAWDRAGSTLWYVDSRERRVDAFPYEPGTAALPAPRTSIDVRAYAGLPDGITVDAEDCLWVAFWRGGAVRRFAPDGRLLDEVVLPVTRTTSCCLGGERLDTLFVTSARRGLRAGGAPPEPLGGAVLAVPVAVPGVPTARWRG